MSRKYNHAIITNLKVNGSYECGFILPWYRDSPTKPPYGYKKLKFYVGNQGNYGHVRYSEQQFDTYETSGLEFEKLRKTRFL